MKQLFFALILALYCAGCSRDSKSIQSPNGSNLVLFPGTKPIALLSPANGSNIDREINFVWNPTNQRDVALGLFEKSIEVKDGSISNKTDQIWVWHKGLQTGREGSIKFSDGYPVKDGIWQTEGYAKIKNGQEYFWAVWAWEDGVGKIGYSSEAYKVKFQQRVILLDINGISGDTTGISKFLGFTINDFNGTNRPRTLTVTSIDDLALEIDGYHLFGSLTAPHIGGLVVSPAPAGWHESWRSSISQAKENRNFQVSWWKDN